MVAKGKVILMMTVRDAMTPSVVSVHPSTLLREVAQALIDNGISGVPVVDVDGGVLGVVSEADLLVKEQGVASISGRVERRSTAEMMERSVRMVPGVLDVQASVAWSMDDRTLKPAELDPVFPFGPR